jgi:hypothetical protein
MSQPIISTGTTDDVPVLPGDPVRYEALPPEHPFAEEYRVPVREPTRDEPSQCGTSSPPTGE